MERPTPESWRTSLHGANEEVGCSKGSLNQDPVLLDVPQQDNHCFGVPHGHVTLRIELHESPCHLQG